MRLSKSSVLRHLQCPFAFHKTAIEGIREFDDNFPPFVYGSEVHEILDQFYIDNENDINVLAKIARQHSLYYKHKMWIEKFINFNKKLKQNGENPIPFKTEIKLYDKKYNISGIIDRVQENKGKYIIIDYKQRGKDLINYRFELSIYTYLFETAFKKDVSHWGIYFAQQGQLIFEEKDDNIIQRSLDTITNTREQIKEEIGNPKLIKRCNRCHICEEYK